ncbi:MAG: hypothetical protein P0S96_05745 [Simkaniaceae bacterium]|nr:hypothetical protein [Candidatus Sacchlamyda saccharinae]
MDHLWLLGPALLLTGAWLLSRSLAQISESYRLSKFALGMTLSAFAVSAPLALFSQRHGIAGSDTLRAMLDYNIANIGLVLGLFLIFSPLRFPKHAKWITLPLLFLVYLILLLILLGGKVSQVEGVYLLLVFALYIISQFFTIPSRNKSKTNKPWLPIALAFVGIGLLAGGSLFFSEETFFAVRGLSWPLLAVALVGVIRKEGELVLGTVLGSCIFNLLLTLPIKAVEEPILFSQKLLLIDFPLMLAFTLLLWVLMIFGKRHLSRLDGTILAASYGAYLVYLFFS